MDDWGKVEHAGEHVDVGGEAVAGDYDAVEETCGEHADDRGCGAASEGFPVADLRGVAAVFAADGGGGGIAPAEEEDGHHSDILGKEAEHDPGAKEVPDYTVVAIVYFRFAH